jgi:hypothetical protein
MSVKCYHYATPPSVCKYILGVRAAVPGTLQTTSLYTTSIFLHLFGFKGLKLQHANIL